MIRALSRLSHCPHGILKLLEVLFQGLKVLLDLTHSCGLYGKLESKEPLLGAIDLRSGSLHHGYVEIKLTELLAGKQL